MILVYLSVEVGFQAITVKELSGGINLSSLHSETKSYEFTLVDKSYQVEAECVKRRKKKNMGFRRQAEAMKVLAPLLTRWVR